MVVLHADDRGLVQMDVHSMRLEHASELSLWKSGKKHNLAV